jgi:hypothetical protein
MFELTVLLNVILIETCMSINWATLAAYIVHHLSWIAPSFCSLLFSVITFILILSQYNWQKAAKAKDQAFYESQQTLQTNQLCIDLYNLRLAVFKGFQNTFRRILGESRRSDNLLSQFWQETDGKEFLFGPEVIEYSAKTEVAIRRLIRVSSQLKGSAVQGNPEKLGEKTEEQQKIIDEITELLRKLQSVFQPYFDFSKYKTKY